MASLILCLVFIFASCNCYPQGQTPKDTLNVISRSDWGGRPPTSLAKLQLPAPFVVIHHTYIPGVCFTVHSCKAAMRSMQNSHQYSNGWSDIGYNFAVGGDGSVFEGRGWRTVGAHAVGYNSRSIGIVLIGDWVSRIPGAAQLDAAKKLIDLGVKSGYISKEYQLIGHRQVGLTECPGGALFKEIMTWDRFQHDIPARQ